MQDDGATLPFWDVYFSNFIEGTEFTVEEAIGIVYEEPDLRGHARWTPTTSPTPTVWSPMSPR